MAQAPNPAKVRCSACARYPACPYSSCAEGEAMTAVHSDTPVETASRRVEFDDGVIVSGPPS